MRAVDIPKMTNLPYNVIQLFLANMKCIQFEISSVQ